VTSRFDRWNPLTPLAASLFLVTAAFVAPAPWAPALALVLALGAAWWAGVERRAGVMTLSIAIPTFLLLALTNAVLVPAHATATLGGVAFDPDAARDALAVSLRLGATIAALTTVVAGIAPRRLTRALAARGLPAWAAYLVVASLEAAPEARARAAKVLDAQRCRGLAPGSGLAGRARALVPLIGPLVSGLVVESEERALALDARGFVPGRRRTALTAIDDPARERVLRALIWIAILAMIVWGLLR
jgi:energy-coupling factor transport system permease protein